jgi:hypothetical protein
MNGRKWIVGEVSKNWHQGAEDSPGLLCERFEAMLSVNDTRGYDLHTFSVHRVLSDGDSSMNETIIAVFKRRGRETVEAGS